MKNENLYKMVSKSNDLIQNSSFSLGTLEQKIMLFIISQIDSLRGDSLSFEFDIPDFCKSSGIDSNNGANYNILRSAIKQLASKTVCVKDNGKEVIFPWIDRAVMDKGSGKAAIKLSEDIKPYILNLKGNFTMYEIIYVLGFRSKYTIRLYELINSIHINELKEYRRIYTIQEICVLMGATDYVDNYKYFKRRALIPACSEINYRSDKNVGFAELKNGKQVENIELIVSTKCPKERIQIAADIESEINSKQIIKDSLRAEMNK